MPPVRSVLVVDDDAVVLRILADQISREGYVVAPAASISEARQHLGQTSFGVVLTDQTMPELSGVDFLRLCRAIQPLASRVLVTGDFGLAEVDQALREGDIYRLLIKPWTRSDLTIAFRQAYERHELLREKERLRSEIAALRSQVENLNRQLVGLTSDRETSSGTQAGAGLRSTNEHASQQQIVPRAQLETLGELASGVAHQFNNALIPILGYVELMLEKDELLGDREKLRSYLRLVLTAAKDAAQVTDRLRAFFRQGEESNAPEPVHRKPVSPEIISSALSSGGEGGSTKEIRRALKVLIVDDDRTSREVLSLFLENDHHEVTAAASGWEALQFLQKKNYDLLVTDQEMAGMTGVALTAAVRKFGNSMPILMVTGYGELMTSSGRMPDGVDLVLNKPVTIEVLRSALVKMFPSDAVDIT